MRSRSHDLGRNRQKISKSRNRDAKGILGEAAFAEFFDLEIETRNLPEGDGNVDFRTPLGTIDVKVADKPWYLLWQVEKAGTCPDILVLFRYDPFFDDVFPVGWAYGKEVLAAPVRTFEHTNFALHRSKLKSFRQLWELGLGRH